jgi:CHASE3 domain sensor protein
MTPDERAKVVAMLRRDAADRLMMYQTPSGTEMMRKITRELNAMHEENARLLTLAADEIEAGR